MKIQKVIIVFVLIFSSIGIKAQFADQQIGNLINNSNWFTLSKEYPKLKNDLKYDMLKSLSEALLSYYFNKPENAIQQIDILIANHQEELGFEFISGMVALKSSILGELGRYAESADVISDFFNQLPTTMNKKDFPSHITLYEIYNSIRNEPKPEIIRPDKDTEVPIEIKNIRKGRLMFIPVTIKGKQYNFIFDTGAGTTTVSESFAKEIGLRVVNNSYPVSGVEEIMGKCGTIAEIQVGDIIFKNPMIAIIPPNPSVDTLFRIDAILGMDFIKSIGEVQIFINDKKIVFPKKITALPKTGVNMLIDNRQPYIKAYSKKERLIFHLDTGNADAGLYNNYYQKHKNEVETRATKDTISSAGVGGVRDVYGYKLPSLSLKVGNTNFKLKNISVSTEDLISFQKYEDGSLGMDFFTLFKQVTINFNEMFVEVK